MSDSSLSATHSDGSSAGAVYKVEFVTPICTYSDMADIQELVRGFRKAEGVCNSSTGIHIHINAEPFNAKTLRNLVNIVASKEDMIYDALQVNSGRQTYCKKVDRNFLERLNKKKPRTMEQFKDIWYNGSDGSYQHYHNSRYRLLNLHIIMMIFTSIYGVVDGFFVSNYVGKTPFAAVNFIMPFLMIFGALGFMIGTGGTALVSMYLGKGEKKKANDVFSMLVYVVIVAGIVVSVIGLFLLEPIAKALGADENMLPYCVKYGRILLPAITFFMLQNVFQSFFITAEKPKLGLAVTLIAGCTNIILDTLFIAVFKWGVEGAAIATAFAQIIGGGIPLVYFIRKNETPLHLGKTRFDGRNLLRACTNGSSEFMTNVSMSIVNMCYNYQLMKLAGQNGVAAYGVIMYVNFIFVSVFLGYSIGMAPVTGFNYGAGNHTELKSLLKKSLVIISSFAVLLLVVAEILAKPLSMVFTSYDKELLALTIRATRIYSLSYLVCGFNIYASSFFTALNNGAVSAAISFLRTLLFQIMAVMLLPMIFGIDGIWSAIIIAEILALCVSVMFWIKMKPKYKY